MEQSNCKKDQEFRLSVMPRKLQVKISFFQDFFGIIEELVGDGPGVGLPILLKVNLSDKKKLLEYQKKMNIPKLLILDRTKLKNIMGCDYIIIEQIKKEYKPIWDKNKQRLIKAKNFIERLWDKKYNLAIPKIEKITNQKFMWNNLKIFIVLSYKTNGTCDEYTQDIRLGIEMLDEYTLHILIHELIHYHIRTFIKDLSSAQDEILVRGIEANVLDKDLITNEKLPDYWNYSLSEIGKSWVNKIRKRIKTVKLEDLKTELSKIDISESSLHNP